MTDDWNEWSKHVLEELKQNNDSHKIIYSKLDNISVEIAKLQVKSGIWGFAAGLIPAIGALVVIFLRINLK